MLQPRMLSEGVDGNLSSFSKCVGTPVSASIAWAREGMLSSSYPALRSRSLSTKTSKSMACRQLDQRRSIYAWCRLSHTSGESKSYSLANASLDCAGVNVL